MMRPGLPEFGGEITPFSIVVLTFVLLAVVLVFVVPVVRRWRTNRLREATGIEATRSAIGYQLDGVSSDILNLEDEIQISANPAVVSHYRDAASEYAAISAEFEGTAVTPNQLMNLATRLDIAVWHLDAAEALLDGRSLPPRPAMPTDQVSEPYAHERRPTRLSSVGLSKLAVEALGRDRTPYVRAKHPHGSHSRRNRC